MAYRFHEQMKDKRWNIDENPAIREHPSWTLQDYRDFMWCVDKGYIVQERKYFVKNPEWEDCKEGQYFDMYAKEFNKDGYDYKKYNKLTLELICHAVKHNKLTIGCDKPTSNLLFINENGGTEIQHAEMIYNHKTYMDRIKHDEDCELFLMLKDDVVEFNN